MSILLTLLQADFIPNVNQSSAQATHIVRHITYLTDTKISNSDPPVQLPSSNLTERQICMCGLTCSLPVRTNTHNALSHSFSYGHNISLGLSSKHIMTLMQLPVSQCIKSLQTCPTPMSNTDQWHIWNLKGEAGGMYQVYVF